MPTADRLLMVVTNALLAQSADAGALPPLYAATVPGLEGGLYIGPDGLGEFRGHPHPVSPIAPRATRPLPRGCGRSLKS